MSRPKSPCGTDAAYRRHLRDGSPIDDLCRDAHTAAGRESRLTVAGFSIAVDESETDVDNADDDMTLILDTLRTAFIDIAAGDPVKLAPIAREFRAAVESVRGRVDAPKELTLAEQLAEARAARAARSQSKDAAS